MEAFILFFEKCRLCLEQPGDFNTFEKADLPKHIYKCTGIKVDPSDNLPQKICKKCLDIVKNAEELRDRANKNDFHLKTLFQIDATPEQSTSQSDNDISSSFNDGTATVNKEEIKYRNEKIVKEETTKETSKVIAVRTDLFDSATTVSSSTKVSKDQKILTDDRTSCKKIRINDTVYYECSICYKTYNKWKKLYQHQRTHNKSVVCPLDACGKRFTNKSDLDKHRRTHTGERPFCCTKCGKGFSQNCTLKAHYEAVHASSC